MVGSGVEALERMNRDLDTCAKHLASAGVQVIAYACTAGSFMHGAAFDRQVMQRVSEVTGGIPAVTTSAAVVEALRFLGVRRVSVCTPYPAELNSRLGRFLSENGFLVVNVAARPHALSEAISNDTPESIYEFAHSQFAEEAEGIFLSCTNWRAMEAAERLEKETRRPVITSNQATIWMTLRALQLVQPIQGCGRLLAEPAVLVGPSTPMRS